VGAYPINELEEIINSLISDKNELVQIAQAYEQEFVAQQISQDDIEYITNSFIPVLKDLIKQTSSDQNTVGATNIEKTIDSLTPLLSVEMLTVLEGVS
jgi:Icc-related predicted phosphoesterase